MPFRITRIWILALFILNSFFVWAQPTNSLKAKEFEKASYKEETILVDVRTPLEWRAGIINGAKLQNVLEKDSFTATIQQWDRSKTYLIYCRSGKRSQQALDLMMTAGFNKVYDLEGGYTEWEKYKPSEKRKIQPPIHRLVIQVASSDTLAWKGLMNNLKHLQEGWGYTAAFVIVAHGQGLDLLRNDKTTQQEKITQFTKLGIQFLACENTMMERRVAKEQIVKEASFVKMGIGEIVRLQEAGWSYIKSGF